MHRRQFLRTAAAGFAALPLAATLGSARALAQPNSAALRGWEAAGWRKFEVTTEIAVQFPKGTTHVWLPLPLAADNEYQRMISARSAAPGAKVQTAVDPRYGARMLVVEWPKAVGVTPTLRLVVRVATRDRHVDLARPGNAPKLSAAEIKLWTQATELLATDGIVRERALEATKDLPANADNVARARAIYEWVVDNTFRDPNTRGCGVGDVKYMLESGNLGGKCADISAVFVALARSLGIPARDVYGIRMADSSRGYRSLGSSGDISRAQHCRAEFHADGYGWIPVDPADVRKVVLEEEKGGLPLTDPKVVAIRDYLFGNWEMNWMAYNRAQDLLLPGSSLGEGGRIGYLMYPNGETAEGRLDQLDPENFEYDIRSREIKA